jgi:archaellum component FlaC
MKQAGYSDQIAHSINMLTELEKKLTNEINNVSTNWKDQRKQEFFSKYIQKIQDHMNACKQTHITLQMKVSNIERDLNQFK